jgi:hypothetical protein
MDARLKNLGLKTLSQRNSEREEQPDRDWQLEFAIRLADDENEQAEESTDGYDCPKCKNKMNIALMPYRDENGYLREYYKRCDCGKIRKSMSNIKKSGLDELLKRRRFDNFIV